VVGREIFLMKERAAADFPLVVVALLRISHEGWKTSGMRTLRSALLCRTPSLIINNESPARSYPLSYFVKRTPTPCEHTIWKSAPFPGSTGGLLCGSIFAGNVTLVWIGSLA
jgi:hypothetical protein